MLERHPEEQDFFKYAGHVVVRTVDATAVQAGRLTTSTPALRPDGEAWMVNVGRFHYRIDRGITPVVHYADIPYVDGGEYNFFEVPLGLSDFVDHLKESNGRCPEALVDDAAHMVWEKLAD